MALFKPSKLPEGMINVTAGGLVFIAGTVDPVFRAFDVQTGKELWKTQLLTSVHAHADDLSVDAAGQTILVIAAGAHPHIDEEPPGDSIVAFTLP